MLLISQTENFGTINKNHDSFLIMIPRVLSCLMMHLTCIGEIRTGLANMKFVTNHPHKFRVYYTKDRIDDLKL